MADKHVWTFRARFRKGAFGWRDQPARKRIREALTEIKKAARKDPELGAEGAILLLEKISPALEHVDSSSGAMGSTVNGAIDTLVPIICAAEVDGTQREKWLNRLWKAKKKDDIPYLESLMDHWGELCITAARASAYADLWIDEVLTDWQGSRDHFDQDFDRMSACLSAMFKAERYAEILELLKKAPYSMWHYHKYGFQALAALGQKGQALRYAQKIREEDNLGGFSIAEACEGLLLESGMAEEAFRRYALIANERSTYLATFRAIVKKYQMLEPVAILDHLIASTPAEEGKWFAAAKSVGLYDKAVELANQSPCNPKTLITAAREFAEKKPYFAVESGVAAIRWLAEGYGYEITSRDVLDAYTLTLKAAEHAQTRDQTYKRIRDLIAAETHDQGFMKKVLRPELNF